MTTSNEPTIEQVLGTLDELAAAARAGDRDRYRDALKVARAQRLTEEQIVDAYRWGRRGMGAHPEFRALEG